MESEEEAVIYHRLIKEMNENDLNIRNKYDAELSANSREFTRKSLEAGIAFRCSECNGFNWNENVDVRDGLCNDCREKIWIRDNTEGKRLSWKTAKIVDIKFDSEKCDSGDVSILFEGDIEPRRFYIQQGMSDDM